MKNENFNKVFIGSGLVAEIFLHALIRHKGESPDDFYILGKQVERCNQLMKKYQIRATTNFNAFISKAKVVVLAVDLTDLKDISEMVNKVKNSIPDNALIISVTPNLKLAEIEKFFPEHPVMRLTLNFSAISGNNIGTYCCGSVSPMDTALMAKYIVQSIGNLIEVKNENEFEKLWKMVFAQSTLAYVALNCMIAATIKAGFTPEQAKQVSTTVFKGTAETFNQKYKDDLMRRTFEYKDIFQNGLELAKEYGLMDIIGQSLNMKPEKLQEDLKRIHQMDAAAEEEKYEFHYRGW